MSRSIRLTGWLKPVTAAVSVLLLVGCAGEMQDLHAYVDEVKSRKQGEIEPLPEIQQVETFVYVAGDRRDPFAPDVEETQTAIASSGGLMPDLNRRKEELESYSLDSLRMVGTLELSGTKWALIRAADNAIHRVKPGNYMGQNYGQILRITETMVELAELIPDGQGGYQERQASLALTE